MQKAQHSSIIFVKNRLLRFVLGDDNDPIVVFGVAIYLVYLGDCKATGNCSDAPPNRGPHCCTRDSQHRACDGARDRAANSAEPCAFLSIRFPIRVNMLLRLGHDHPVVHDVI